MRNRLATRTKSTGRNDSHEGGSMGYLDNLIINTDNYKHCHYPLYPPGTEYVSSYIESRGGEWPV
ncbi:nicotinamide phosphoribosyltransferase domain-containing protein, partial [Pseudonocardia dioxanivorans]|uniref:nicotinamide phosphoribosyltransferase domain-containing protein n=1 Tax=Pseudonocardia dioxanivorans TaxID=240495 RepID=UPI001A9FA75A